MLTPSLGRGYAMNQDRPVTGSFRREADARSRSFTDFEQRARALQEGPSLLANMHEGYVYARMVFEGETPVDYVYLLVNDSWARLTGLCDPIGRRVTELVPGIRETNPELFEAYGRVVRTGQPERFEVYLEPIRRWFSMSAYRPEEGCFACVFQDVTDQKRTEDELRQREAQYRAIVETSADGVLVVDPEGRILEANDTYLRLSGYSREELLSMGLPDLESAEAPEETARHMERVVRTGSDLFETEHRSKDGRLWRAEVTVSFWPIAGGRFFAFLRDLKRRSRLESILHVRLRIGDLATRAGLDELVTATLDSAEDLTSSRIGFFHFVGDDQVTLRLQAWSTNTVRTMCTAEGKGRHYPADEAGVWADALRTRAPVVHNDYASLPHRRGLPEGHAPIVREIVVPVIRRGKVVALLGVGNKETDYDQSDVDTLVELAGLVIDVLAHKQAEELLAENARLLRILAEAVPSDLAHIDAAGRYERVNAGYARWFGKPAGAFPGRSAAEVLGADAWERLRPLFERALAGETVTFESEFGDAEGGPRWGRGSFTPDQGARGEVLGVVSIVLDVTERCRAEAARGGVGT